MVRWLRWHCPPDTWFEIRALAVWGRARYLSVTEAPHNTDFHTWMGKKHFCFFQTVETGNRTPNSGVKGGGANHYPRAPALRDYRERRFSWATSTCMCGEWRKISPRLITRPVVIYYFIDVSFGFFSTFYTFNLNFKRMSPQWNNKSILIIIHSHLSFPWLNNRRCLVMHTSHTNPLTL